MRAASAAAAEALTFVGAEDAKKAAEDEALKLRMARESRFARLAQNLSSTGEIVKLQEEANSVVRKIEVERANIAELDSAIGEAQSSIIEQKRRMGGVNAAKENHTMIARQIRLFENRLDKSLIKFNESLARNKKLREKIDDLRRERVVFDGVYKKLERELHDRKKEIAAIIEDSKNAYQARDQAQSEIKALQADAETERTEFEREWEKLGRAMEEELKLRETMGRIAPSPTDEAGHGPFSRESRTSSGVGTLQRQASGAPVSSSGASLDEDGDQGAESKLMQKAEAFNESFERIREAVGCNDVNDLADSFLMSEDRNFSLFNFVNGQRSEIERLELRIATTKKDIEVFQGLGAGADAARKKALRVLADKVAKAEAKRAEHEARFEEASGTVAQLRAGIQSIFTRLGANRGLNDDEEGVVGNQGVTEANMMQHLGIIEQRATDCLQSFVELQHVSSVDLGVPGSAGLANLSVVPPAWEDTGHAEDDDEFNDDERPLNRVEAHRRTIRSLGSSGASPSKAGFN